MVRDSVLIPQKVFLWLKTITASSQTEPHEQKRELYGCYFEFKHAEATKMRMMVFNLYQNF